jgi:hypothetical protein
LPSILFLFLYGLYSLADTILDESGQWKKGGGERRAEAFQIFTRLELYQRWVE